MLAIDTGGTFTDLAAIGPSGNVIRIKVPSSPAAPHQAVREAIAAWQKQTGEPPGLVRHGSTVATNALLERRGARVVLLCTAGLEDVLRLRRQDRPHLYALHPIVPLPLVVAALPVRGRLSPDGQEVEPLEELDAFCREHAEELSQAESMAICLLHGYAYPRHEKQVASFLRQMFPGVPVSVSSEIAPLAREYERTSTVAVNAYVAPAMGSYLARLSESLRLAVMGSAGGLMTPQRAASEPVHTVLSGPAGGVLGALAAGRRCGRQNLLSLDMGGTSTDISVVLGSLAPDDEGRIAEHPLRVPLLPIETIGAGGGSIAFIDAGGALRVGPRSAGAEPGPACYGRAGPAAEPTVTDAHVVLGRLPALLAGQMSLDARAAKQAVARLGSQLGASIQDTALAIVALAEANMARGCKRLTMERGIDPRDLTLVAFGGAGGLHACALADTLGCADVIFPHEPGVLSAEGMLHATFAASAARSPFWDESRWSDAALAALFDEVLHEARKRLAHDSGEPTASETAYADCRYRGQTFTLPVGLDSLAGPGLAGRLRAAFDLEHERRYGFVLSDRAVELVAVRGFARRPEPERAAPTPSGQRRVLRGPAVLPAYSATLWLPEGWVAETQESGDTLCTRRVARSAVSPSAEPLALEIHRQRLAAIAEEMGAALMRASFSANIKERRDFSCALFDAAGRMLVQAAHIPVHLGSQPMSVEAAIDAVSMRPGDQVVVNDPYAGGTHLPDITLVSPVFVGERGPLFYVANRAHHADVGGLTPGSMPTAAAGRPLVIEDEGIRIAPTRLDDALSERIARASRTPVERRGDLRAQQAANTVGQRGLRELLKSCGEQEVLRLNEALLDYSQRRMRAVIAALPDGTYTYRDALDDDGTGSGPVPIPVTITIASDRAVVDFSAVPDARPGSLNAVRAITISAVFYVFRCLAGDDVPANAGMMRVIEVVTRPGSLCDARYPSAVSAGNVETSQRLVDTLWGALAQAAPDRVPAASCGTMNNVLFGGLDPRPGPSYGRAYVHYETLGGGAGGSAAGPGADAIHTHMTNTLNTPIEELERLFPVRVSEYALRPRPAPIPGTHAGGAGIRRAYTFLGDAEVTLVGDRRVCPPYGLGGAPPGQVGRHFLISAGGARRELAGKQTIRVGAGDTLVVETPSGGSWRPAPE